ncbi:hypothetical protein RCL1_007937 [Eukaryota sp. TZLM3-RCL]
MLTYVTLVLLFTILHLVLASTTLEGVIVVTRHGDRAPLYSFENQYTHWNCSIQHTTSLLVQSSVSHRSTVHSSFIPGGQSLDGNCHLGQLTLKGGLQHVELGKRLRTAYDDLLPTIPDDTVYFRSTNVPRTIESLIAQISATFPALPNSDSIPLINLLERPRETLLSNAAACPRLSSLLSNLYSSSEWVQQTEELSYLKPILNSIFGVKISSDNDWNQVYDYLYAMVYNDIKLPSPLTLTDFDKLFKLKSWQLTHMYNDTYLSLSLGQFAQELITNVQSIFDRSTTVKYSFFSAHDLTILPLMSLLNVNDGVWPDYASYIAIETWLVEGNPTIKVVYNDEPVQMKHCSDMFCPIDEFIERLSLFKLTREEWIEACMA